MLQENQTDHSDEYFKALRNVVVDQVHLVDHLVDENFAIDNTIVDPTLTDLRDKILKVASEQQHWGEPIPARWITLEKALLGLEDIKGLKIYPKESLQKLNHTLPVPLASDEELSLFLRFQHDIGNIIYFSDAELGDFILLDPQWLVDAFKCLITAKMFLKNKPICQKWQKFNESAILTPALIDEVWTPDEQQGFHHHRDQLISLMEKRNMISRPRSFVADGVQIKVEDFFVAPCMLKKPPDSAVLQPPTLEDVTSTSIICFTITTGFIPMHVFNWLLSSCLTQWPVSKKLQNYLIYCGAGVFDVDRQHRLTLFFSQNVIQLWVKKFGQKNSHPRKEVCTRVREFIEKTFVKIKKQLRDTCEFKLRLKCPAVELRSNEGMFDLEDFLTEDEEVSCHCHDNSHILRSSDMLKYWGFEESVTKEGPSEDEHSVLASQKSTTNIGCENESWTSLKKDKSIEADQDLSTIMTDKSQEILSLRKTEKRKWKSTSDLTANSRNTWREVNNSNQTIGCLEDMTLENACQIYGLHSEEVNMKCQLVVEYLETIDGVKRVWPAYKALNRETIVFIVLIEAEMDRRMLLLSYPYSTLNIRLKSTKTKCIEDHNVKSSELYDTTEVSEEEMKTIDSIFNRVAPDLLDKHSNLCAIFISPVKSKQNGTELNATACFVLYVHAKGLIPINEEEFPKVIDGVPTDVREGIFVLNVAHKAREFHDKLLMGCRLSRATYGLGTVGPFLTEQNGKVFCLTSAHVVLSPAEYDELQRREKITFDDSSNGHSDPLDVFQPDVNTKDKFGNTKHFGKIRKAVYKAENKAHIGSVEVVLVEITDRQRTPLNGDFPDGQFETEGFTQANPLTFKTGLSIQKTSDVRRTNVFKYGSETGLTTGAYRWMGQNVCRETVRHGKTITLYNQIQIDNIRTDFATHGDSGAIVLVPFEGKEDDMRALGIVTGRVDNTCMTSVTPIWDLFDALDDPSLRLKSF